MRKKPLVIIIFLLLMLVANIPVFKTASGESQMLWERTYPMPDSSGAAVIQTTDGGYAVAGICNGSFLLLKVNPSGDLQWNKTYGDEAETSRAYCVVQTADGGYALAGVNHAGSTNFVKTDSEGNMQWNKTISNPDAAPPVWVESLVETSDGGLLLIGYLQGGFGDWVVKTDESGNIQWNKTYGMRYGLSLTAAHDSGYIVNVAGSMPGSGPESYLLKIDGNGDVQWNVTCGWSNSLIRTGEGGYILSGASEGVGWLEKRDSQGEEEWHYGLLGEGAYPYSSFQSVAQAPDGGYVVADSVSQHVLPGGEDAARIVKTDSRGNKIWSEVYGADCGANSVIVADDGNYVFTGSKSGVVWLVKIGEASTPTDPPPTSPPSTSSPSPTPTPSLTPTPPTSPSPSPSPSIIPSDQEPEPFPTTLVVASTVSVATIAIGLLIYFRKRKGGIKRE